MPCIVDSEESRTHATSKDSKKEINGGGNLKMNTGADENCATANGDGHVVENGMKIEESHVSNGSEDAVTKESEKLETDEVKTQEVKQEEEGKTRKKEDGDKSENPEGKTWRISSSVKSPGVCRGKVSSLELRWVVLTARKQQTLN